MSMVRAGGFALLFAACSHGAAPPVAPPPAASVPAAQALADTAGAVAFLEEMAALARSALLRQPLPTARLPLRPEAGRQVVSFDPEEQMPPAGRLRRLYVAADTALKFGDGGCLRMTVLVGPTGFRVGGAKFAESCGPLPNPPALAPLTGSLASIAEALAGRGGNVPWFTVMDVVSCTGEEAICEPSARKPDDAALASLRTRLGRAGAPVGVGLGELGPIEIGDDRRAFHVEIDAGDDMASIKHIKVKQVRAR
jgi:hypothetical protein